jgi:hypothetical protein
MQEQDLVTHGVQMMLNMEKGVVMLSSRNATTHVKIQSSLMFPLLIVKSVITMLIPPKLALVNA